MIKNDTQPEFKRQRRIEMTTFAVLMVVIVGGLVTGYYYDQQRPFFATNAQLFYSWLLN